ncbi:hypothetical protein H696_02791 [Fonticula alba]|uniref:ABC transporter domain-containing protein n=1 Tax=Fonticula alba TaxID=691883 RepID=A0A058Z838_FONAL|nr:hypothetical protein H696_02791 [Fonticula alba]KCV70449.1 hypothetical protein H696_02791 [Fonticula alba]|eukprot:XP_009494965.1 hypothetical protein H696_02791 [Fonticula alba]
MGYDGSSAQASPAVPAATPPLHPPMLGDGDTSISLNEQMYTALSMPVSPSQADVSSPAVPPDTAIPAARSGAAPAGDAPPARKREAVVDMVEEEPVFQPSSRSVRIDVRNLNYIVQPGLDLDAQAIGAVLTRGRRGMPTPRKLLDDVSMTVLPGELCAVIGSSGSGKTTLLDVIAARHQSGGGMFAGSSLSGDVLLNGLPRTTARIRAVGGYVAQEDRLPAELTVREVLSFVARIRMSRDMRDEEKLRRADAVAAELGLIHVAHTPIGGSATVRGVSGGERRRVSIGTQLLLDPAVLFADEPTSGLDAYTARHVVSTLRGLARAGRTVLCTIHAPRADVFRMFDKVMILSQGQVVYFGAVERVVDYFSKAGHPCPIYSNPCDYYLDLSTVDFRSERRERTSRAVVKKLVDYYRANTKFATGHLPEEDPLHQQSRADAKLRLIQASEQDASVAADNAALASASDGSKGRSLFSRRKSAAAGDGGDIPMADLSPSLEDTSPAKVLGGSEEDFRAVTGASVLEQFRLLYLRSVMFRFKARSALLTEFGQTLAMGLAVGVVFYALGSDQVSVQDRFGLCYIVSTLFPFMVILSTVAKFHADRPTFYTERQDGLYRLFPFYMARILADLPFDIGFSLLYSIPIYLLAGLDLEVDKFFAFQIVIFLCIYASRSIAVGVASMVPRFQQASFVANFLFTMFLLPCGFIFNMDTVWIGIRWLSNISFVTFTFQALSVNEFRDQSFDCPAPPVGSMDGQLPPGFESLTPEQLAQYASGELTSCPIPDGESALELYAMSSVNVLHNGIFLVAVTVFFRTLCFLALKYISQRPR